MHRIYCWVLLMAYGAAAPAMGQSCHLTEGWSAMSVEQIELMMTDGKKPLSVRVADNSAERAAGYQWICAADAKDTAVLFVFPKTFYSAFHMRNVFIPLDIYFFDGKGQQVGSMLMRAEPPGQGIEPQYYSPAGTFRYALEIPRIGTHDLSAANQTLSLLIDTLP